MTSEGIVYVDETVDEYSELRLPSNWTLHTERRWGSIGASMRWCFRQYPQASQYGWLADDTLPRTEGWDKQLEQAAGRWCLSFARDNLLSETKNWHGYLERGEDLTAGLCWGGDLVRAVGWWAPPRLKQAGIDTTWAELIAPLGLARYVEDVTVEHRSWRNGSRPCDAGDKGSHIDADIAEFTRWRDSPRRERMLGKLRRALP